MGLLIGREVTLLVYSSALVVLLVVLWRLRWRTLLALFLLPLAWMSYCYGVLVWLTLAGREWEFMIPFLQVGQWILVLALVVYMLLELSVERPRG